MTRTKSPRPTGKATMTNYMESLTDQHLENLLSGYDEDFTPDLIQDIKALALNRLWPMYTTSSQGRNFVKKAVVEDKIETDVVRELRAAIERVRSNPRG